MKTSCKGFILVMTLFTISVISLLILACMQHILMYYKGINQLEALHHTFYQLDSLAMQLSDTKSKALDARCVVPENSPNTILQRLRRYEGCSLEIDGHHYRYFVEELGDYPCLIAIHEGKKVSTHHRRISVLALGDKRPDSLVQLRSIEAIKYQVCEGKERILSLSVSSWRYLAAI